MRVYLKMQWENAQYVCFFGCVFVQRRMTERKSREEEEEEGLFSLSD
jgi:hypothetical protein